MPGVSQVSGRHNKSKYKSEQIEKSLAFSGEV